MSDEQDMSMIEPCVETYHKLVSKSTGYSDDGRTLYLKSNKVFNRRYTEKDRRNFFIDEYTDLFLKAETNIVNQEANWVIDQLRNLYGSYLKFSLEIGGHGSYWCYNPNITAKAYVIYYIAITIKDGIDTNLLKLKYPELVTMGIFKTPYGDYNSDIKQWFKNLSLKFRYSNEFETVVDKCFKNVGIV